MLFMAGGLLSGWIMSLFGFKAVVIAGMAQLFGASITSLGYYFIFAMIGLINGFIYRAKSNKNAVTIKFDEILGKATKATDTKKKQ